MSATAKKVTQELIVRKRYSVPTFRGLLSRAMIAHEPRSL